MREMRTSNEARYRLTGDDLSPDAKAKKDAEKKKIEDSVPINYTSFTDKQKNKVLSAVLFTLTSLLALYALTSSQSEAVIHKLRQQDNKVLEKRPYPTCNEDKVLRWLQSSKEIRTLKQAKEQLKVGLVNFKAVDSIKWELFSGGDRPHLFKFKKVKQGISWADLYPEQIDEEHAWNTSCPAVPLPVVPRNVSLDLVIGSIPCSSVYKLDYSRDANCLQAFLAAARVAESTAQDYVHVALCGECRPVPNLFVCKELVEERDGVWLYKVDVKRLRNLLTLPVGSCQLALPTQVKGEHVISREAYATILHSAQSYVCGAITLAHSIRSTGSKRDLVILVDENIKPEQRQGLNSAGWKVFTIERIRNPKAEPSSYNEWNYSKFRLWQLTQYDKLVYIDADIAVLRNLDMLFDLPEISATRNDQSLFNSGVMVIEPSNCTYNFLVEHINDIDSYNGGDQGYLNEVYTWWHRLPVIINFLKHFDNDTVENTKKLNMFTAEPPVLYGMHFLGIKPWLCYRDYDCNWNQDQLHIFANDAVHTMWWKIYDSMPPGLQQFCALQGTQKFLLEWDIIKARRRKYRDGHWKIPIQDPRWHSVKAVGAR